VFGGSSIMSWHFLASDWTALLVALSIFLVIVFGERLNKNFGHSLLYPLFYNFFPAYCLCQPGSLLLVTDFSISYSSL
jgi:hypothetical protein